MFHLIRTSILEPDASYPLFISAKCYVPLNSGRNLASDALTLILLHSTSFHKETWEPFLEDLFELVQKSTDPYISEAWVIECPNHGESAILNEELLSLPEFNNNFTCRKYADAAHRFLTSCPGKAAGVDFIARNLVGIGHSLGGVAMTILQSIQPRLEFRTIFLVEPMLSPDGSQCLDSLRRILVESARKRQDSWETREDALSTISRRTTTRRWDSRTIKAFVNHAIRPYAGHFVLSCTRKQEIVMYEEKEGPVNASVLLNVFCECLPFHIIYGSIKNSSGIPLSVQKSVLDPKYRRFASVSEIEGVGHLVPQEKPRELAEKVHSILSTSIGRDIKFKL